MRLLITGINFSSLVNAYSLVADTLSEVQLIYVFINSDNDNRKLYIASHLYYITKIRKLIQQFIGDVKTTRE